MVLRALFLRRRAGLRLASMYSTCSIRMTNPLPTTVTVDVCLSNTVRSIHVVSTVQLFAHVTAIVAI